MKLLCCTDTHGEPPGDFDERGVACWLHAGDAEEDPPCQGRLAAWAKDRTIPVYSVRGNHDVEGKADFFSVTTDVTGRVVRIAEGILLAGVGWHGKDFFDLPREEDLEPCCLGVHRQVLRIRETRDRIILLTHYPPRNDTFEPKGLETYACIEELIRFIKPELVVFGHLHEWSGQQGLIEHEGGRTRLVNPGVREGRKGGSEGVQFHLSEKCSYANR